MHPDKSNESEETPNEYKEEQEQQSTTLGSSNIPRKGRGRRETYNCSCTSALLLELYQSWSLVQWVTLTRTFLGGADEQINYTNKWFWFQWVKQMWRSCPDEVKKIKWNAKHVQKCVTACLLDSQEQQWEPSHKEKPRPSRPGVQ